MSETSEPEPDRLITHCTPTYRMARFLSGLELALMHRCKYLNREFVPSEGPALIVCNHQSFLDIPIISNATPGRRHVCFVARASLAEWKPMALLLEQCGSVLIKPGTAERGSLNEMIAHLNAGDLVCVYPEGTRSHDGRLGEFLPGAVFAAKRARVPLIPAGIRGAFDALPRGSKWPIPRLKRISMSFGPPIDSQARDALEQAKSAVQELVGDGKFVP